MTVLADVLGEARTGASAGVISRRLGLDRGLVEAALDQGVRLGLVTPTPRLGAGCEGCAPGPSRSLACAGCIFRRD